MPNGRILYFNHDDAYPSGGVRTIYPHVRHLVRNGFPAFVVHCHSTYKPAWFDEPLPTIYYETKLKLHPDDLLVIPENHWLIFELMKTVPVKKIIFCQNHFYIFNSDRPGVCWRIFGISDVLAGSEIIAQFIESDLGRGKVPVVHYAIDPQIFKPGPKKMQIAFMPRKLRVHASFIRGLCAAVGGSAREVQWIEIDHVSEQRVAEILSQSAIFLSLSQLEGFGLPPIEAMACGCTVVGYHGYGGLEYANQDNGFWCEEGNPIDCAKTLRRVIDLTLSGSPWIQSTIQSGIHMAARYNPQRQETELLRFINSVRQAQ